MLYRSWCGFNSNRFNGPLDPSGLRLISSYHVWSDQKAQVFSGLLLPQDWTLYNPHETTSSSNAADDSINREEDVVPRSEKWSHCGGAFNLLSFNWLAGGDPTVYEKIALLLTWIITSVKSFLMSSGSQSSKSPSIEHCVGFVNYYATIYFKIQWAGHGNPFPWQHHNVQNAKSGVVYKPAGDIMMAKYYSFAIHG